MSAQTSKRLFRIKPREPFMKPGRIFLSMVHENIGKWNLDRDSRKTFRRIIGEPRERRKGANLGSNLTARQDTAVDLQIGMSNLMEQNPDIQVRHMTVISDEWRTGDRDTVVDLEGVKRTISQLLRGSGLDGHVGIVEIQAEALHRRGYGRDLMVHAHLLIFSRDDDFSFAQLQAQLRRSPLLTCASGAPTVVITGGKSTASNDVTRWCWYFCKPPAYAKNLVPCRKRPGETMYMGSTVRPNLGLRLTEVLSRLQLSELLTGGGIGREIAAELRREIVQRYRLAEPFVQDRTIADFWLSNRVAAGKDGFKPVTIKRWKHGKRTRSYKRGPYRSLNEHETAEN